MTGVTMKQIYLLLICQGFYLGSVCQRWTFPSTMVALIDSCVEIPCTYHPDGESEISGTVWYLYRNRCLSHPEVLNTKDSSSVMKYYKGRTSLVPGENSCTLRIDPVREEDGGKYYYPGISGHRQINAHEKQDKASVRLNVTDKMIIPLSVPEVMTEGEAATIRCSVYHTCRSSPPSLQWNKPGQIKNQSVEISGGSWREESELTYIPSYVDDGSFVQCKITLFFGLDIETSGRLNINYSPKNVTLSVIGMDEVIEGSDVTLQYSPKNVTVTVIGMDEVMEGSDVTLQCNSFSKPDVHDYEWYKGKTRLPDRGREMTVAKIILKSNCRALYPIVTGARPHKHMAALLRQTAALLGLVELDCSHYGSQELKKMPEIDKP
ncbi:Schwann cell myelin protein-like [Leptodactylus fuscus]|uniref:Schwann cell myelin protein-like n=1 Tax=Leptodactylus fuscus TaxID=238119 RepID=UPI003F4EC668